jgi:ribonuclease G
LPRTKKVAELDQDLRDLEQKWSKMYSELKDASPRKKLLGEMNRATTVLRDELNKEFTSIHVNDESLYTELKDYVRTIAPEKEDIVKYYQGKVTLFENRGINKQIKAAFGRKVNLKSGAYLIIDHTEAMHVVDVNSSNRKATNPDQELNALDTNLEAAHEIARLLRLRDMGGIVAVDFIDMYDRPNNKKLIENFRQYMKDDKAKHNIQQPSRFGVVELTRQRVRPETEIKTTETCPSCLGKGEVQASILVIDEIEHMLQSILEQGDQKSIFLNVHPFVEAFLRKGVKSIQRKWFLKHKKWVTIRPMTNLGILQFHFLDQEDKAL